MRSMRYMYYRPARSPFNGERVLPVIMRFEGKCQMGTKLPTASVFFFCVAAACAETVGLVSNSGFEEIDSRGWAKDWKQWPKTLSAGASVTIDGNVSRTGARSLRISQRSQSSYSRADQIVSVTPNKKYMISCWVRGKDLDPAPSAGGARLFIGRNGTGNSFQALGPGREAIGTFPWTRYEIGPVAVGEQTRLAFLPYLHKTSGTVWFDDIEIVEVTPDMTRRIEQLRVRNILLNDLALVEKACREAGDETMLGRLADVRKRVSRADLPTDLDRRHGPPFFELHREIYRILGAALARRCPDRGLLVWSVDPFVRQEHLVCPPMTIRRSGVTVHALRNDVEQVALNLTNATSEDVRATLSLSGPVSGLHVVWREVVPVELRKGILIDDALPRTLLVDREARTTVPPGMTRQIWLEIHTGPAALTLGGAIRVRWANRTEDIPLSVRVYDLAFPDKWPIYTFCYAYLPNRPLTKDRIAVATADLARHHVNAIMPQPRSQGVPDAVFGDDGALLPEKMDWSTFDATLAYSGYIDMFVLLIPPERLKAMCTAGKETVPFGGPTWEKRAGTWVRAVIAGLKKRGIGYDRMVWTSVDEPAGGSIDTARTIGRMFHRADPSIRVYSNFYRVATPGDVRRLDEETDVWAPSLDCLNEQYLPICARRDRELWAYRVQSKGTLPASVRGAFWRLFALDVKGYSFWTYTDAGADPWTPYDIDRHDYHVVYTGDPSEMIPSKRWEAWREGVEDYTLLWMLSRRGGRVPPAAKSDAARQPVTERSDAARIGRSRGRVLQALAATP